MRQGQEHWDAFRTERGAIPDISERRCVFTDDELQRAGRRRSNRSVALTHQLHLPGQQQARQVHHLVSQREGQVLFSYIDHFLFRVY